MTDDGWETAPPSQVNIDVKLIGALLQEVAQGVYPNVHSLLLVRNGKLVVEAYFPGQDGRGTPRAFDRDTLHEQHSVTKSVTATLIGIAIDQHLIAGAEARLSTLFPEYPGLSSDPFKKDLTLRDCLTMSAGLSWDEWKHPYTDPRNVLLGMNRSGDPVRYVLERPAVAKPGTVFAYNGGLSITLGAVIHRVSGVRADSFANQFLFGPLGIREWSWERYSDGTINAASGLQLRPRDMAKIGQLFLNGGRWHGKMVVSEAWIHESTQQRVEDPPQGFSWWQRPGIWIARRLGWLANAPDGYGYHWWHRSLHAGHRVFPS